MVFVSLIWKEIFQGSTITYLYTYKDLRRQCYCVRSVRHPSMSCHDEGSSWKMQVDSGRYFESSTYKLFALQYP